MQKLSVKEARLKSAIGAVAKVQGWVRTRRDSKGGFSFLEVNDGSCLGNLQVIAPAELANYESELKHLTAGCSVTVTGEMVASGGKGQATELRADAIKVHGWADAEHYPLQKKRHSFEKLREWSHLRPRTNAIGAVMRVRNRVCRSIHDFFQVSSMCKHRSSPLATVKALARCFALQRSTLLIRPVTTKARSTTAKTSLPSQRI
jgi:asparaginyl-tRNA synthetase